MARLARRGVPGPKLDVLLALDQPAWATLVGLIDECPVIHAGLEELRTQRMPSIFCLPVHIQQQQIAAVEAFMDSLPENLALS